MPQKIKTLGKISAQPHTTLCIQFLDRENKDKNNRLPLGKQISFTIVWGCAEILPKKPLGKLAVAVDIETLEAIRFELCMSGALD